MAENRVQPDLLVELGARLMVAALTPRAQTYMMATWRDMLCPGQIGVYELPTLMLDPLVFKATEDGLLVVVRKGRS
jgi:hypothetical protein